MTLYELLLVGHISGALVAAGGAGAAILATVTAGRAPDLPTILRSTQVQRLGGRVAAFALLAVMLLGTWLVLEVDAIGFDEAWISASYALWLVMMGIGGGIVDRHARRLNERARAAIDRGETTDADVQAAWNAVLPRAGLAVLTVLYVVFLYLMVVKPGA